MSSNMAYRSERCPKTDYSLRSTVSKRHNTTMVSWGLSTGTPGVATLNLGED